MAGRKGCRQVVTQVFQRWAAIFLLVLLLCEYSYKYGGSIVSVYISPLIVWTSGNRDFFLNLSVLSFKLLVDYWGAASCHLVDHMTLLVSRKWPLRMVLGCSSFFILTAVTMSGDTSSLSLHMACLMLLCRGVWICNSLSPDWWGVLLPSAWRLSQCIVSCDLGSSFSSEPCWGARWGSLLGSPHSDRARYQ